MFLCEGWTVGPFWYKNWGSSKLGRKVGWMGLFVAYFHEHAVD